MAPSFFTKLVKSGANRDGARSPSPSSTSPAQSQRHPTISVSRASQSTHRPSKSLSGKQSDTDNESINPNVTVIPPSPRNSDMSASSSSTPKDGQSLEDLKGGSKKPRRQHALSLSSSPLPPPSPVEDDAVTPTPSRPAMSERESTLRPLSHSSSTGNLREQSQGSQVNHPRSATVATGFERQQELQRTPSLKSNKSNKSNRSGMRIKVKGDRKSVASPPRSMHERPATSPNLSGHLENGGAGMSPIVESPTKISSSNAIADVGLSKHTLSTSATVPSFPNSSLLAAPDKSDAASIYSVGSTSKKRRMFRRLSVKESAPVSPGPASASTTSSKSPKRKTTGLAGAIAASGLAMANPVVSMPQITPAEIIARDERSNSHRSRSSIDRVRSPTRSRQASLSYAQSEPSDRDSFVSGIEGSDDDDDDDLDLDVDDIPVTGFAVASARRNQEFHEMFPAVPEGDYLIEDYGCALQREILVQGRIYISENHICFHANLFGWVTDLTIPMYDVIALDKRMTAFVIPNAIQVTTRNTKYTFTSFLSRDTTFDVIYNVWRLARPDDSASQIASGPGSLDHSNGSEEGVTGAVNGKAKAKPNKVTQCACGKNGQHYTETAMETVFPGTPEKIYNLMFTSGFIKEFMRDGQKLMDIQISDWEPLPGNAILLSRNMSYIKPLTASIGPRQTRCELRDEMAFCEFEEYVSMVTTTRTPEVPSGSVFSVKTRTCIMWASSISTKVIITTQVEWTGRSFIKGIVEKSAIDGQKTYHVALERSMRDYIHRHQSEFIPEGVDVEEAEAAAPASPALTSADKEASDELKVRELERSQRGLQWAYETLEGTMKVAKQSTEGALELIRDAWDQSSASAIMYFVIVLLVISNIWTLVMMGKREEVGRRKEMRRTEEREKWVQGIVTALWDELTATKAAAGGWPAIRSEPTGDVKTEVAELNSVLDRVEERVQILRKSLQDLD